MHNKHDQVLASWNILLKTTNGKLIVPLWGKGQGSQKVISGHPQGTMCVFVFQNFTAIHLLIAAMLQTLQQQSLTSNMLVGKS